ncbi:uncharacterized protein [Ptychodera flava]|uniref:uncharacterized protein n=1 Tax=Ptychodera flava TaxID=63121 RepID=UPI00396A510B
MDTTDGVSLNLMRNIRLIIPQNVDNQREQTRTVEQSNDCPSLSSQDCHCLWEAAKQSNVTEKLGHYFEKCSRELMYQIQRDSLLDRDKTAMLNFLCQYGILKMKMESSLNLKAVATSDGVVTVNGGIGRGGHSGDVRLNGSEYAEVSGLLSRQQDNEPVECFEKSGNIVNRRQKHCQAGENSFESATGNTDLERESSYVLSGSSSKQRHSRDVGNSCELLHVMCDSSNHDGEDDDDVDFEGSSAGVSEWYHERENNRSDTGSSFSGIPDQEEGVTECIAGKIPESVCGRDQQGQGVAAATFVSTEQTESEHNNLDNSFDGSENATLQRQRFEDSIQTEKRNVKTEHEEEISDADSEQKRGEPERSGVRESQEDSLGSHHFEDQEIPQAGDSYRFELEKSEEECQSGSTTIIRKPLQKTILGKKYLKSERARNRPDCAVSKTLHEGRETAMYWYVEEGGGADAHGGDSSKQELCMRNLRGPVNQEEPPVPVSIVQKYESASTADAVQRFESTDRSQAHIVEGDADLSKQQEKSPSLLPSNNDLGHVQTVLPSQLLPSNSAASDHPRTSPGQLLSRDMSVCGASLPSPLLPREQSTPYARAESLAYVLPRAISHSIIKFQRTTAATQELSTKRRNHRRSSQKILTESQIELKREQDRIRQRRHREKMRRMKIAQIQWASTEKQRGFHKKKAMRQNFSNTSQSAVPVTLTRQANIGVYYTKCSASYIHNCHSLCQKPIHAHDTFPFSQKCQ